MVFQFRLAIMIDSLTICASIPCDLYSLAAALKRLRGMSESSRTLVAPMRVEYWWREWSGVTSHKSGQDYLASFEQKMDFRHLPDLLLLSLEPLDDHSTP